VDVLNTEIQTETHALTAHSDKEWANSETIVNNQFVETTHSLEQQLNATNAKLAQPTINWTHKEPDATQSWSTVDVLKN
jgi:hypothetical protein